MMEGRIPNRHDGYTLPNVDYDFTKLAPHKHLKVDHNYKISMFPYSDEFYCLEMRNFLFPMKVLLKNVKHSGTLTLIQELSQLATTSSILALPLSRKRVPLKFHPINS